MAQYQLEAPCSDGETCLWQNSGRHYYYNPLYFVLLSYWYSVSLAYSVNVIYVKFLFINELKSTKFTIHVLYRVVWGNSRQRENLDSMGQFGTGVIKTFLLEMVQSTIFLFANCTTLLNSTCIPHCSAKSL